ncbi:MAG: Asp-tRNA(Asn)/Glu-tRNA(Gln) amidotransferase subunit GatA [candidate division WOR-3 bacterium]
MKTIANYHKEFERGEYTPLELLEECLRNIDPEINAFITVTEELARESLKRSKKGRLRGIPIAVKDNINIKGVPTTCGSGILRGFIPPYSATVIERIESEGGIFIGKTNLDEFGMGSSTERSFYGPTKNPYDLSRVPGGSSGGSAAALASGSAIISLGSDTGGSVRQPASYCGLVGLKPTYGRVSRYGLVAFASSLDQIGIIGRNSEDVGLLLSVIAGYDKRDSTSSTNEVEDYENLEFPQKGIKIGIPEEYFEEIDEEVYNKVMEIKEALEKEGFSFKKVSLPSTDYIISTYQVISYAEASSNLARYDGVRYGLRKEGKDFLETIRKSREEGFLPEVKRRILVGTFVLSSEAIAEYYERADLIRKIITWEFEECFKEVDYLFTPATPTPAFPIGERTDDPIRMHIPDRLTAGANLSGIPAIVAPAGFVGHLPIGYQIMGRHFDEKGLLSLVKLVEKIKPFKGLSYE